MKKTIQSLVLLLMVFMVPATATAAYEQLAEGVYQDGSTLYIGSGVTSLGDLQVNPSEIYCYATIPPACMSNTFASYDATLHVPAAGMVSYFTTLYWYNFNDILSDAIEPLSVTMNTANAELEIGQQLSLSATVTPGDATPKTVYWSSGDASVASVSAGGTVTAMATGECDILATCVDKVAICHVSVVPPRVTISLDMHEARLLPNHTITLTATCSLLDVDLAVTSSDPSVAIPRLVNGTIMVVGVAEGTATITVNAADGWGNPDSCIVTVYTEHGDVNCNGYISIADVTSLIDYLLSGDESQISTTNADVNKSDNISIADVTTLIDYLLSGIWPWEPEEPIGPTTETFTVNGVSFTMVLVEGGTFTMGATPEQGSDVQDKEKPVHEVTLSNYCIGETEVTQALWVAVMGDNPSPTPYSGDMQHPVIRVSWYDCQEFISKLNEITGKTFRLPTEAEWEYAARGGNQSHGYKYAGSNQVSEVAWCKANSNSMIHPVATKAPNELGLYDLSGNVFEWCQDFYGSYSSDTQTDPVGPTTGSVRIFRGGSWNDIYWYCRVSCRESNGPYIINDCLGLRLALDTDSTKFRLSKTVVEVENGECLSIDILNGSGSYTIYSDSTTIVKSDIKGEQLVLIGMNEGKTTVIVKDNITQAQSVITAIVKALETETYTITGYNYTATFTMVKVHGGTFIMGAQEEDSDDWASTAKPAHQVTLSDYSICKTEVTQQLWRAVMGTRPSHFGYSANLPVECVNWNMCQEFISKLNELTGCHFRLPTEAEWEFAARGGNKSQGYIYAGDDVISRVAWYYMNSTNNDGDACTHTVGVKKPNELGLYDMSGNVLEWCQDWYGEYGSEPLVNPTGPENGSFHVFRGGCWNQGESSCRVAKRQNSLCTYSYVYGLRLAL